MATPWYQNSEAMRQACSFKPGDMVFIRPELAVAHWYKVFIKDHGPGPFMVLKIHNAHVTGSACILLGTIDGEIIHMPPRNDPGITTSWMYGHIFVRNNFLGAVHKAITCNPSQSEQ